MKKFFSLLVLLAAGVFCLALSACSDDDKPVSPEELPGSATAFITAYFPGVEITSTVKDGSDYDVVLQNGYLLEFDKDGEWKDVDAPAGLVVPVGFYPEAIDTYIGTLPDAGGINEISRSRNHYEVETLSGLDLRFDKDGAFIGFDD